MTDDLEKRLLWARWRVADRRDAGPGQEWRLESLAPPHGHPATLRCGRRFSGPEAWLVGAESASVRLDRHLDEDWPEFEAALERLRQHPDRVSTAEFTVAGGLRPGMSMEDIDARFGPVRQSSGSAREQPDGSLDKFCECDYAGEVRVVYRAGDEERWTAELVEGPTLEDAGRVVARAGDAQDRLREVLGPPQSLSREVEDLLHWHPQVRVHWGRKRRVRSFELGPSWYA